MTASPLSLYKLCLNGVAAECVDGSKISAKDLRFLPNPTLFDFYYKLYEEGHFCLLCTEQGDLANFKRLLSVKARRTKLLRCFQSMLQHGLDQPTNVASSLIAGYSKRLAAETLNDDVIDVGLKLGGFFNEGGWFSHGVRVLSELADKCNHYLSHRLDYVKYEGAISEEEVLKKLLTCYHKKLYGEMKFHDFQAAGATFALSLQVIEDLKRKTECMPNFAALYSSYSMYYFLRGEYKEAYHWSNISVKLLNDTLPNSVVIDVLRQASKTCVMKRDFKMAGFLIRQAFNLSISIFLDHENVQYTDVLSDYGFYLLNYDLIEDSIVCYRQCLQIRQGIFKKYNLLVASAHEDLSYASYVHEYSTGEFYTATLNAEEASKIYYKILPPMHLLVASANRVKALILEEIALDLRDQRSYNLQKDYLRQAEKLQKAALTMSLKAFGEKNIQTAKHYGNLGRLYQTMKRYSEAEEMHLKAIAIKEELLGENDYEIALSVGHLASLYNYHMSKYEEAEKLYKRSIEINLKLFGPTYSGLEYDYRGLTQVYINLLDTSKVFYYNEKMREWKKLREEMKPEDPDDSILPVHVIVDRFMSSA